MEHWENIHVFRQVEGVCRRVRPSLDYAIRTVIPDHELGDTVITALHIVTTVVEGTEQDTIANLVRYFG